VEPQTRLEEVCADDRLGGRDAMKKRALITGITGQTARILRSYSWRKGYEVHGVVRRSSSFNTARLDDIYQDPHERIMRLKLVYGDLNDARR